MLGPYLHGIDNQDISLVVLRYIVYTQLLTLNCTLFLEYSAWSWTDLQLRTVQGDLPDFESLWILGRDYTHAFGVGLVVHTNVRCVATHIVLQLLAMECS